MFSLNTISIIIIVEYSTISVLEYFEDTLTNVGLPESWLGWDSNYVTRIENKYISRESNRLLKKLSLIKSKIVSQIESKIVTNETADTNDGDPGGGSDAQCAG